MADKKRNQQGHGPKTPAANSGAVAGIGGHPRAGGSDAGGGVAAAGLVISETTPIDGQQKRRCHSAGHALDLAFSADETARKRLKRLRRNVWFAGRLHGGLSERKGHRPDAAHFVTLTYVGVNDWSPEHLTRATDAFRRHCKRMGVPARYLWVAELQKRGAVHYHLVAWLPKGVRMPHWDKSHIAPSGRRIEAFWTHGMSNTQPVKSSAIAYLMKYLSKATEFHVFPAGLRLFGVGGLDDQSRCIRSWTNLPEWAKCEFGVGELRRMGSHLVIAETGELVSPVWRSQPIPSGIRLTLLRDYPKRFHDGPWSPLPGVAE